MAKKESLLQHLGLPLFAIENKLLAVSLSNMPLRMGFIRSFFASKTGIIPSLLREDNRGQLLLPFAIEIS